MKNRIGIRREGTDPTEKRAPFTPEQVARIVNEFGIEVIVQPSNLRVYADEDFVAAGASLSEDVSACNITFGVREIPVEYIERDSVYCFFSHTTKAQRYNMPMLRHIVRSGCTLLDYELVASESGRRLICLGEYAGYAGMIDSLWALGQRLDEERIANPFTGIRQTTSYNNLSEARTSVEDIGRKIRAEGLPEEIAPFVCAFTGRGHVSRGAQEIFNLLPVVEIRPEDLPTLASSGAYSGNAVYRVEFSKPDLYEPFDPGTRFDPDDFMSKPGHYKGRFHRYVEYLTMIINGVYWSPRFPRLLTREHLGELYTRFPNPRLKVVGDITCDVEGSIEFTMRQTTPDNPIYVFEPASNRTINGCAGDGPVVLAVNKLAAELPRETSGAFGEALLPFVADLARADFSLSLEQLDIPESLGKAIIAHRGGLTENFRYLNEYLL